MSSTNTNTTEWDNWFTTCCTEYVAPSAIKGYNYLPRGGVNIAEVNFIQAYTTGEWNQYIWSVIIVPGIILGMLLMWILLLFLLKCLGQKRVGFWSGASMEKPLGLNAIDSKTGERIPYKRPRRVRICFMIFALLLLVFTATYTILGIGNLQTTATHLVEAGNIALNVTEDASDNLKTLTAFVTEARMRTDSMINGIDELSCPALNMDEDAVKPFKEQAMDFQTNNLVFVDDTLLDLQTKMITLQDTLSNVTYVMETSNSAFSNQPYYCIPIVVLVVLLMLSLILVACTDSSKHRSLKGFGNCWSCLTTWFLMPLFILVMILFWIFGCTIFVTAIMNADMCQGTPPPSGSSSSSSMSYVSDGMSRESPPQKEPRTDVVFTDESSSGTGGNDQKQEGGDGTPKPNPVYTLMAIFGDYTYYTGNQEVSTSSTTNTYQISKLVQYYAGCDMLFPYKENYLFYLEELYQTIIPNAQTLLDGTGGSTIGSSIDAGIGSGSDEEDSNTMNATTTNTTDETLSNTTETTTNGTLSSVLLPPPAGFIPGEGVLGRPTELSNGENLVTPALPLEEEKKGNGRRFLQKEREPNDEVLDEGEEPDNDEMSDTEPTSTSGNETTSEVPTLYNTTGESEANATTTTTDEPEEEEAMPEVINITTTTNDTSTDTDTNTPTNITTTTGECMSPDDMKEVLEDLQLWLNELEQSPTALKDFIEIMSCERVSPAYAKSVNEALCNYNITALTWLMMSMLSMSICGFVMITLRSAVKPVVLQEESDDDDNDNDHREDDNMETNPQVHGAVLYSDNEGYADDTAYQKAMDQVGGNGHRGANNDDSDSYEHDPAPDEQRQIETGVYTKLRAADDR